MITSFEVGAIFRLVDQASPALRKMLATIRELRKAIDGVKLELGGIANAPALGRAIGETKLLADEWKNVAKSAAAANRAIGRATGRQLALAGPGAAAVAETQAMAAAYSQIATSMGAMRNVSRRGLPPGVPPVPGAGGSGGGGRHRPGFLGGSAHVGGPSIGIPGGGHVSFRGGAAAAIGALGYGAYEAAEMEDAVFNLMWTTGAEPTDENKAKFRKMLQDSMVESGYSLHDVAEAAKKELNMFQGTPGGGVDVMPEMLRAAAIESRRKGSSLGESMQSFIGLSHMTKQYSPEEIKKLAPAFAFLSTANPGSLASIEKAASYALPILQSGLDVDPVQSLLLGTALTRAGATSTKSGTWLREMAIRAMPGTSLQSKTAFKKHETALKAFGLVDDEGKPTWFTEGKPDLLKMLDIAGARAQAIPLDQRAGYERSLFGAQGSGSFALAADPAVREQIVALRSQMDDPKFKNRYASFMQDYDAGSAMQRARTTIAEFNVTMMDIGDKVLPPVTGALKDFKAVLEGIRNVIPSAKVNDGIMGKRALEGAVAGAAGGFIFAGPGGALAGGVGGGVIGAAEAHMEQKAAENPGKHGWWNPRQPIKEARERAASAASQPPLQVQQVRQPVNLSLNIDGRTLAQAVSEILSSYYTFATQAPAADGLGQYYSGDHNFPSK